MTARRDLCPGSLGDSLVAEVRGEVACQFCGRPFKAEQTRGRFGIVPEHEIATARSYEPDAGLLLARGRRAALDALRAHNRGAWTEPLGWLLTSLCQALGLPLEPSDCRHPTLDPSGSHCPDCGYEPESDGAEGI